MRSFWFLSQRAKRTFWADWIPRCLSCLSSQVKFNPIRWRLLSRIRPSITNSVNGSSCSGDRFMSLGVTGRWVLTGRIVSLPLKSKIAVWILVRSKYPCCLHIIPITLTHLAKLSSCLTLPLATPRSWSYLRMATPPPAHLLPLWQPPGNYHLLHRPDRFRWSGYQCTERLGHRSGRFPRGGDAGYCRLGSAFCTTGRKYFQTRRYGHYH